MPAVRRRLSWVVAFWLVCQVAGVVAAPLALCCRSMPAADDNERCCPGLLPGQIRRVGRSSQGVRTMRVDEGGKVVAIAPVIMQMEENGD